MRGGGAGRERLCDRVCVVIISSGCTGGEVEIVAWRILAALALGQRREIKKSVAEVCPLLSLLSPFCYSRSIPPSYHSLPFLFLSLSLFLSPPVLSFTLTRNTQLYFIIAQWLYITSAKKQTLCLQIFAQLLPTLLMLKGDGSTHPSSSSLPLSLTTPSSNATVFVW